MEPDTALDDAAAVAAPTAVAEELPFAGPAAVFSADLGVQPWAIEPSALPLRLNALPVRGAAVPQAALPSDVQAGTVAVVSADGVILPRCDPVFERMGWCVSCETLVARVEAAVAAGAAAVVVRFNSPGGSTAGVPEAARRIAAAARETPVVAVADHLLASAAYYLAAGCTAIVASDSAMVGSVGVLLVRPSFARAADADGVDFTVLSRGAGKTDLLSVVPVSDAARERLQAAVDVVYADFVAAVSRGRGVPRGEIQRTWGAHVLTAGAAKAARMVDSVAPASAVMDRVATAAGRRQYRRMANARATLVATSGQHTARGRHA